MVQTSSSSKQLLRISNLMVMTWKSERDGLRRQDTERASRHMQTNTWSDVKHVDEIHQQVQSHGERQTRTQNCKNSLTTHVPSQPMDLSDMSARVRLNMKRSPFESQGDRSKQRRVMEDPDEDDVMIGEVQVNEEVEHPMSEVSVAEFDD